MLDLNILESVIFSRIKSDFSQKIKEKYKNLEFTTQEASKGTPKFPNVYVYLMPGAEIGRTLRGNNFSGGLFTFQIKVTNNTGQTAVQEITNEVMKIMKKMSFEVVGTPSYQNDADTQWSDTRFRRPICNGDIF